MCYDIVMKKYIIILSVALLTGFLLSFIFFNDINREVKAIVKKEEVVYLFQTGVFKDNTNAINYANLYNNSIIYYDGTYYRVIIGVAHNSTKALEEYFTSKGINYYLKEINIDKTFINDISSLENILNNTKKEEVIEKINKEILELFKTYL